MKETECNLTGFFINVREAHRMGTIVVDKKTRNWALYVSLTVFTLSSLNSVCEWIMGPLRLSLEHDVFSASGRGRDSSGEEKEKEGCCKGSPAITVSNISCFFGLFGYLCCCVLSLAFLFGAHIPLFFYFRSLCFHHSLSYLYVFVGILTSLLSLSSAPLPRSLPFSGTPTA